MDFNITALILSIMFLAWQGMMWKKVKLNKWKDCIFSSIAVALTGWLVYLAILS